MDFQTMLKKVKQKQYKSKREFKDDLDLIWSNCYTYNATEVRPSLIFSLHSGLTSLRTIPSDNAPND
jgi:transcriptional activator SPT7